MVAAGKISIAADENKSIPLGWLLDTEGNPTTDPKDYDKGGALVAFGGHKGFGLSIMVETMAGLLSGGAMLSDIHAWNKNPDQSGNVGHLIIAMDPKKLNPNIDMPARTEAMIEELASAKRAPNVDRILYPGQLEHEREDAAKLNGIELPQATLDALYKVALRTNLPFEPEKMM
jgi:LDH2 family malate/lactate/ureidoglycolate dehydrogenase